MPTMKHMHCALIALTIAFLTLGAYAQSEERASSGLRIVSFQPMPPLSRAERPTSVAAVVENLTHDSRACEVRLELPEGMTLVSGALNRDVVIGDAARETVTWELVAKKDTSYTLRCRLRVDGTEVSEQVLSMLFLPSREKTPMSYIPEPVPVEKKLLVGAHNCPLWEADRPEMWAQVLKHPERTPALGFYAQENPEVADWETKWAVEHGIDFFIYCWYRASQGEPVKMNFASAIHDAFFKSRFIDKMKFTIMWENQARGRAGVADERDLKENLLPFWIDTYFKHPSYLVVDNKPVLFIYRPEFLIDDLGSKEAAIQAIALMRRACREAGFDGLYILGEYRGLEREPLELIKQLGLDYSFAYCWYIPDSPTPEKAIATQLAYIRKTQEMAILPQVVTVSQAWSGWADEGSIWKIPPGGFETLLRETKDILSTFPEEQLGSRMLLLDNWNEWGEGHYIAPYREYGFGYLDAVRTALSDAPEPHVDLLPEDIGLGPYDTAYRDFARRGEELRSQLSAKAMKSGVVSQGLIAWWAFDEAPESPVALDYSGNRLGGKLRDATRAPGVEGHALVCDGGAVVVPNDSRLSPALGLTIECWVRTDVPGQGNAWIVNRIFGGGTSTGYRLGVLDGHPCFEVPFSDWSHHLKAEQPLPLGRWVHLAATFDGETMRIYVDGQLQGVMGRPGPVHSNAFHLCLGNYEVKHEAHFRGLLDEVRLYDRALTAEEVEACAREHAS